MKRYQLKYPVVEPAKKRRAHPRRVSDRVAPGRRGTVVLAFRHYPVSIVKWDDGAEQYVLNEFLIDETDTK